MDYNLLDQGWIPVLYAKGEFKRVGIIAALTDAHSIRDIATTNPMDRVAIVRFLLVILYWCDRNPPQDSFAADCLSKLEENRRLFNLFGEQESFYQDHAADGKPVAATSLLHDLPSGTNIAHFRHLRDFRDGLCPACCALGLLRWSVFATASKKGKYEQMTASINGNTPAYALRAGADLFETLRLNWPGSEELAGDLPVWAGATETSTLGVLKGLTWQSRRVLLAPWNQSGCPLAAGRGRNTSNGECCYCGKPATQLVRSVLFRPGWQRPKELWAADPHLLRTTIKGARGKEKEAGLSWPGPDDALERAAGTWRHVCQALLERLAALQDGPALFRTTLVGSSQALYKRAEAIPSMFPSSDAARNTLQCELGWLQCALWSVVSARVADWGKRPKGHAVVHALCSAAAKGHSIRSSLCAASGLAESGMERAFANLIDDLENAKDENQQKEVRKHWRREVGEILRQTIRQSTDLTTRGSALRRIEARQRAESALNRARCEWKDQEVAKR